MILFIEFIVIMEGVMCLNEDIKQNLELVSMENFLERMNFCQSILLSSPKISLLWTTYLITSKKGFSM